MGTRIRGCFLLMGARIEKLKSIFWQPKYMGEARSSALKYNVLILLGSVLVWFVFFPKAQQAAAELVSLLLIVQGIPVLALIVVESLEPETNGFVVDGSARNEYVSNLKFSIRFSVYPITAVLLLYQTVEYFLIYWIYYIPIVLLATRVARLRHDSRQRRYGKILITLVIAIGIFFSRPVIATGLSSWPYFTVLLSVSTVLCFQDIMNAFDSERHRW